MVLRWMIEAGEIALIARDAGVSQATGYRYLHEAVQVIADRAPELTDVLARGLDQGWAFVCLDGTLIPTTRSAERSETGQDVWYSGKHTAHGGNIQVACDDTGYPVWTCPVEPGSTHDITAARAHALGALYKAAADGMPTLADKGYTGAGIGLQVPTKGSKLAIQNESRNLLLNVSRAPAERANALLKSTFRLLRRITVCPHKIGDITKAALVLLTMQRGRW